MFPPKQNHTCFYNIQLNHQVPEWRKLLASVKASKRPEHEQLVEKQTIAMTAFNGFLDNMVAHVCEAGKISQPTRKMKLSRA